LFDWKNFLKLLEKKTFGIINVTNDSFSGDGILHSKKQLNECKNQLGGKSHLSLSLGSEFSIGITASIFLFFIVFLFSLYFQQGIIQSIVYGLASSSIPMWSLFILGNFGGYDVNDLPLFSCWFNRLKGFLIALFISFSSYLLSLFS